MKKGSLPQNEFDELIKLEVPHFAVDEQGKFVRRIKDGITAPYIEWEFRGDLIQRLHDEYGHLSAEGMKNLLENRGWWPKIDRDIYEYRASCANYQIAQRARMGQECEYAQLPTPRFIEPFQRWGIDLIGILPKTKNRDRWILTAIEYAMGWPIAKPLPEATEDIVEKYLKRIQTKHKGTSPYHPHTNGKVGSLNGLLGNMLTKYLMGKPTKLWDQYLDQALFACRVRIHSTTQTSPFYLVYGKHPRLLGDDNYPLDVNTPPQDYESRLKVVQSAR